MCTRESTTPGVTDAQWNEFLRTGVRVAWIKGAIDPRLSIRAHNEPYNSAAHFAYLDVCRTFRGARNHPGAISESGQQLVSEILKTIAGNAPADQTEFDQRHREICELLVRELQQRVPFQIFLGQAQKWINMAIKYAFAFGDDLIPGISASWYYAHVPIDNYVKDTLASIAGAQREYEYLFDALAGRGWSRISNYERYLAFQTALRTDQRCAPLSLEYDWWQRERDRRAKA